MTLRDAGRIVIVGAGLAGLVAAERLIAAGIEVSLVEAGPRGSFRHEGEGVAWPDRWRNWSSSKPYFFVQGSGLKKRFGGRSLCWHGVVLQIDPVVLADDAWNPLAAQHLTSRWRNGKGLYETVEAHLQRWSGRPLADWCLDDSDQCLPVLGECLETKIGMVKKAVQYTGKEGTGRHLWRAYSPIFDEQGGTLAAQAVVDAPVGGVDVSGGVARGVIANVENSSTVIRADAILLAAGTMENTRLVGQAIASVENELPIFGNLMDHVVQGAIWSMPASAADRLSLRPGGQLHAIHSDVDTFANYFIELPEAPPGRVLVDVWSMGEHHSKGLIRLLPRTDGGLATEVDFSLDDVDRQRALAQQGIICEMLAKLGEAVGSVPARPTFPSPEKAMGTLESAFVSARSANDGSSAWGYMCPVGSSDHEAGTLPIGGTIIDEWGEVRSIKNLFVLGPCTFPRSGSANPSLTTMALTWRTCGHIS